MGNVTGIIRNVIGVLVVMAALGITWPIQMVAVDGFYKKFVNHCEATGVEYTRMYERAANTENLELANYIQFTFTKAALSNTDCGSAGIIFAGAGAANTVAVIGSSAGFAAGDPVYNEHNDRITGATITAASSVFTITVANAKLKKPMPILTAYDTISVVILGAIPVLSSVTFIGAAGFNLYRDSGSSNEGMVSKQVLYTIGALIGVIVVLFGMPILLGFF